MGGLDYRGELGVGQVAHGPERVDSAEEQHFRLVDVAEAREYALVEERVRDGRRAARAKTGQGVCLIEGIGEDVWPEPAELGMLPKRPGGGELRDGDAESDCLELFRR